MVEFNANGLGAFFTLLKNLSVYLATTGKEWAIYITEWLIEKCKWLRQYSIKKFKEYFTRQDLSKEELRTQIGVLQLAIRTVLAFVLINFVRVVYRMLSQG